MGFYINPPEGSKEGWLAKNATLIGHIGMAKIPEFDEKPEGTLPIILVHNGGFTAAGITYNELEYQDFTSPNDPRPKVLYYAELGKILEITPDLKNFIERLEREAIEDSS